MSNFGIIVSIGPGQNEVERLRDLLESVFFYEPMCRAVVLVDDVPQPRNFEQLVAEIKPAHNTQCQVKVFVHPRAGRGLSWSGGMTIGILMSSLWLAKHTDVDFAVRLDTDSLVIAPFGEAVTAFFAGRPDVGQVGTFRFFSDGSPRDRSTSEGELPTLLKPFALRRRAKGGKDGGGIHPQTTLWGRARRRAEFIRLAQRNGFVLGEAIQGGGYAMSRSMLDRMKQMPELQDVRLFLDTTIGDDTVTTIVCYACGLTTEDFNRDGQVFAVAWSSLPDQPARLLERGFSIIHSIKNSPHFQEAETRQFFQKLRQNA